MNIGIIGVGEMGGTLAKQYVHAGHTVKIGNTGNLEKLKSIAITTGATAELPLHFVPEVDVIVICIPMFKVPELTRTIADLISSNAIVIDTGNYYPIRDGIIEEIENGMPEGVWVSNYLRKPVIKAYNTILYRSLLYSGTPRGSAQRIALPLSGDDFDSITVAQRLANDSGFDSLHIGGLKESWRQQPGSPAYCTDLTLAQLKKSIPLAKKQKLPERRELGLKYIMTHDPEFWKENVEYNREIYESLI